MPENFEHYFKTPKLLKRIYRKIVWKWVFDMYRQLPLIVSPTLSGANEMLRNGYEKPIHIQSCGIDRSLFSNPRNKADIRTDFGLPDLPIVLYTGRLDKEKNIDIVLKACAIALRKIKFHLVITGTGKEENKLKKLGEKLGIQNQIKFTGKLDDSILPEIYSASDIFVNACNVELQCISALEAIAAGLPVLLSDSLALPELINKEKPNGFCFRPNDSIQLAEKLVFLLSNAELRKEMGNNSLKLAIKHDIANTASGYIEYYKKVIK
jgi:glycosyltransferase involved in cell wall biosynthesis